MIFTWQDISQSCPKNRESDTDGSKTQFPSEMYVNAYSLELVKNGIEQPFAYICISFSSEYVPSLIGDLNQFADSIIIQLKRNISCVTPTSWTKASDLIAIINSRRDDLPLVMSQLYCHAWPAFQDNRLIIHPREELFIHDAPTYVTVKCSVLFVCVHFMNVFSNLV